MNNKHFTTTPTGLRTVLFATAPACREVPVPDSFPAALLPFGAESFIERILSELSEAGIRQITLVVSDHPEALRLKVGNGDRWGISIAWNLVKNPWAPYEVLRHIDASQSSRVLIGHADRWISGVTLHALIAQDNSAYLQGPIAVWSGWASATPDSLKNLPLDTDFTSLASLAGQQEIDRGLVIASGHFAGPLSATELISAQQQALACGEMSGIPAAWLRMPWGAMSPTSTVHPDAIMHRPVLAGPGCLISAGAQVGPHAVLVSDVIVSSGTSICNSIVLTGTFLGNGLELRDSIVHGNEIQNVRLGARISMPRYEGLLMHLRDIHRPGPTWVGRTVSAVAIVVFLPLLTADFIQRYLRGSPPRWTTRQIIVGQVPDSAQYQSQALRIALPARSRSARFIAHYGGLLDIAAGKRCWFGIRPREKSEWYALSRDWQGLFSGAPVGLLHSPAWFDTDSGVDQEASAAADAYFSSPRSKWQRIVLRWSILMQALSAQK